VHVVDLKNVEKRQESKLRIDAIKQWEQIECQPTKLHIETEKMRKRPIISLIDFGNT